MTAPDWVCQTPRLRMRRFQPGDQRALVEMHREPRLRALLVDDFDLDRPERAREFLAGLAHLQARHPGLGIWHTERWLGPDPNTVAEAEAALARGEIAAEAVRWVRAGRWRFCGWFNLMPMPEHPQRVEIGCRLLPCAWGTGLVLDGGEALLAQAFGRLALNEVWAVCHPRHRSVHAVLATLGFAALGLQPYCGTPASQHRLRAADWARVRQQPRRERQREASRSLRDRPQPA